MKTNKEHHQPEEDRMKVTKRPTQKRRDGMLNFIPILLTVLLLVPTAAGAHCDTMDGPVVMTAKKALEAEDVTPVLKWVEKAHEKEIRDVFEKTLAVRKKGPEARELADLYFFETLVRVHRAGEGAPYTGLKPGGSMEPAIAAADKALDTGSVDALADRISRAVREGIRKRHAAALELKSGADGSVENGRKFVAAYVEYVHFIEGIHGLVSRGAAHHSGEASSSQGHTQ